jgi:hypothetical protein
MGNKNIVIAPCGNKSFLFRQSWLNKKEFKEFDLCLLFYHEKIEKPEKYEDADYFFHLKNFKYHMIHDLLTRIHPEWLAEYEYFYFLDDDIEIDTEAINTIFQLSRTFKTSISQAALTADSYCSWPIFKQKKNSFCRFVGQVEVMAPLFNQEALRQCLPSFNYNKSSWGLDSVWSKILGYPQNKMAVFDFVTMRHTLPVGGGELYVKIGIDPHDEWREIIDHYEAKKHDFKEYGRLQLVDSRNNRLQFLMYKQKEKMASLRQAWNDYDLKSRIMNKGNKILKMMMIS